MREKEWGRFRFEEGFLWRKGVLVGLEKGFRELEMRESATQRKSPPRHPEPRQTQQGGQLPPKLNNTNTTRRGRKSKGKGEEAVEATQKGFGVSLDFRSFLYFSFINIAFFF